MRCVEIPAEVAEAYQSVLATVKYVPTNKRGNIPGKDGKQGFNYDYASYDSVLAYVQPILAKHGFGASHDLSSSPDGKVIFVAPILTHTSGHQLIGEAVGMLAGNGGAQAAGSAMSYGKRYTLLSMLGLATKDDDGAAASRQDRPPVQRGRSGAQSGAPASQESDPREAAKVKVATLLGALSASDAKLVRTAIRGEFPNPVDQMRASEMPDYVKFVEDTIADLSAGPTPEDVQAALAAQGIETEPDDGSGY